MLKRSPSFITLPIKTPISFTNALFIEIINNYLITQSCLCFHRNKSNPQFFKIIFKMKSRKELTPIPPTKKTHKRKKESHNPAVGDTKMK